MAFLHILATVCRETIGTWKTGLAAPSAGQRMLGIINVPPNLNSWINLVHFKVYVEGVCSKYGMAKWLRKFCILFSLGVWRVILWEIILKAKTVFQKRISRQNDYTGPSYQQVRKMVIISLYFGAVIRSLLYILYISFCVNLSSSLQSALSDLTEY